MEGMRELYICPFCKKQFDVEVNLTSLGDPSYPCEMYCDNCHEEFHGVDTLERCKVCPERVLECWTVVQKV